MFPPCTLRFTLTSLHFFFYFKSSNLPLIFFFLKTKSHKVLLWRLDDLIAGCVAGSFFSFWWCFELLFWASTPKVLISVFLNKISVKRLNSEFWGIGSRRERGWPWFMMFYLAAFPALSLSPSLSPQSLLSTLSESSSILCRCSLHVNPTLLPPSHPHPMFPISPSLPCFLSFFNLSGWEFISLSSSLHPLSLSPLIGLRASESGIDRANFMRVTDELMMNSEKGI